MDSSDILLGAVLFDMEWPKPRNMGEECVYDIKEMKLRHRNINKELEELGLPLFVSRTFPKKNSSFFESVMHVTLEMQVGNIPTTAKLLRQAVMFELENSPLKLSLSNKLPRKGDWHDFFVTYQATNSGLDLSLIHI